MNAAITGLSHCLFRNFKRIETTIKLGDGKLPNKKQRVLRRTKVLFISKISCNFGCRRRIVQLLNTCGMFCNCKLVRSHRIPDSWITGTAWLLVRDYGFCHWLESGSPQWLAVTIENSHSSELLLLPYRGGDDV